jgi:hypothetical protein
LTVVESADGNYVVCGYGFGNLMKLDVNGSLLWNRNYTFTGAEFCLMGSVKTTSDHGYIITGGALSLSPPAVHTVLVKTDANGELEWSQLYSGSSIPNAVIVTPDGGYALCGSTSASGAGGNDMYLIKTDSSGNVQWTHTYGGAGDDSAVVVVCSSDGGYVLAGNTNSFGAGSTDAYLVKAGSDGTMLWNKTFGNAGADSCASLIALPDGCYVLSGQIYVPGNSLDAIIIKTDHNGVMQWNKTYGGTYSETANTVIATLDGGYALVGYTSSYGAGFEDFWLFKDITSGQFGLAVTGVTTNTISLYRGYDDPYWEYVRVQIWKIT